MPAYVALTKWTDQGVKSAKDAVDRAEQRRAAMERAGGRMVGLWWTQAPYDAVLIVDWPDEESAGGFALSYAATGNVRTETMRAYSNEEMQHVLSKLA